MCVLNGFSHLAVDVDTHEAISAEVSLVNVGDSEVLPTLLNSFFMVCVLNYANF